MSVRWTSITKSREAFRERIVGSQAHSASACHIHMRIVFACSSVEPGLDGVGDYARRLAGEFTRQGHQASIVALNDSFVDAPTDETQEIEGVLIQTLRLPRKSSWGERTAHSRKWVDHFAPDWVSLQFVGYGFHSKGLPVTFASRFMDATGPRRVHLMLHELWVGEELDASWSRRATGLLQRLTILRLVRQLRPAVIHTQAEPHRALLKLQ